MIHWYTFLCFFNACLLEHFYNELEIFIKIAISTWCSNK
nr:MAG TPA: hypothetical protein [Caudoviricetes sp.]